jgi:GNAT superfamily N-acetyltransferase
MNSSLKSAGLKLQRIQTDADPAYPKLVRIYTESHPASERKPAHLLSSMIKRPEYVFLVANKGNLIVGFSIALCFLGSDACLLEYMAVDHDLRNQGIGQFLFKGTMKFGQLSERYCIIEVDSDKSQAADNADRIRRKLFYRRLGCREIGGLSYIMPPVSNSKPPAMELLVFRRELSQYIQKSQLKSWLESCYSQVYGMPANDCRIESMLRNLPDSLQLM